MTDFEILTTKFMERVFKPVKSPPVPFDQAPVELYDVDDNMIDKGTGDYIIEKYSGGELEGVMLKMKLNGKWCCCTLNFLRQLKKAKLKQDKENS